MQPASIPLSASMSHQALASAALAAVVSELFPGVVLAGSGVNSIGFYHDFVFDTPISQEMLEFIEVHLLRFIKEGHEVRFLGMMKENAQAFFEYHSQFLLADLAGKQLANILDIVQIGAFHDLYDQSYSGESIKTTQEIGRVKLLEISQVNTLGNAEEMTTTRLLGVARPDTRELKIFCKAYDSFLKKQDHRVLGPKLKFFSFSKTFGELGLFWHPKGLQLQETLTHWLQSQIGEERYRILSPLVARNNVFSKELCAMKPFLFDEKKYRLRSSFIRSHLEFLSQVSSDSHQMPERVFEFGPVFREISESQRLALLNSCAYSGDFATIYCPKEQVFAELISSLHLIEQIITIFCFEAQWCLKASRGEKTRDRIKDQREIDAIDLLKKAYFFTQRKYPLDSQIIQELEEETEGNGPHLELSVRDSLGRLWPISRLKLIQPTTSMRAFSIPEKEGKKMAILTRSVCLSLERLIALALEWHQGVLPFWLAPEQVRILALGVADIDHAAQIVQCMQAKGIRAQLDCRHEKLGTRIHEAEVENIPYLVLIGEQERMKGKLTVRSPERRGQKQSIEDIEAFLNKVHQESICPRVIRKL